MMKYKTGNRSQKKGENILYNKICRNGLLPDSDGMIQLLDNVLYYACHFTAKTENANTVHMPAVHTLLHFPSE